MLIRFEVVGSPKGQPRARACRRGSHAGVYDPGTADGWKSLVAYAARPHLPPEPISGPVDLSIVFRFERPKKHVRKSGELRPDAPSFHTSKPDRDNLDKAVMDSLVQCRLLADDCCVVTGRLTKLYVRTDEKPGCTVVIDTDPIEFEFASHKTPPRR